VAIPRISSTNCITGIATAHLDSSPLVVFTGQVPRALIGNDAFQEVDAVKRALAVFGRRRSAGFTDCLVVETARKAGHVPVGTFDKAMSRMDGAAGI